ncbi:MAG TPA: hypothetical protein VMW29_03720 [Candidatus Bathyarchaeia archaeon]|nr:hypothetical protein [Candidatus Bathyarchaeia archaeon]
MRGIKTLYKGTIFRSRLEAKWAAFFDFCKWKWEYEPFDLDGWIPDFILMGVESILVEVKPYTSLKEFKETIKKIKKATFKNRYRKKEILLLGCMISLSRVWEGCGAIGWLGEIIDEDSPRRWYQEADFNNYNGEAGFFPSYGCWKDRMTGLYDGDHFLMPESYEYVKRLFNKAGSKVQWKA